MNKRGCVALALVLQLFLSNSVQAGWSDWVEKGKALINRDSQGQAQPVGASVSSGPAQTPGSVKVLTTAPSGIVDESSQNVAITVTFDRPMVALEALPTEEKPGPLLLTPPVKGIYRWLGTSTLVFKPEQPLQFATEYTATIPAGTTAMDGTALGADFQWKFETIRPQFLRSFPYHRTQFVDIEAPIYLNFNMPMTPNIAGDFIELRGTPTNRFNLFDYNYPAFTESAYTETFDVRVDSAKDDDLKKFYGESKAAQNILVVRPRRPLKKEYTYTLVLKEGLPSGAGPLGMLKPSHLQYKTYNHFRVLSVSKEVHPEQPVEIEFSNPVSGKELATKLSIDPALELPKELGQSDYESTRLTLYLKLIPKRQHRLVVKEKIKDKFGQKLEEDFKTEFAITSYVPYLSMPTGFVTVESYLKPRLPVTSINLRSALRGLLRVTPAEAIPMLTSRKSVWNDASSNPIELDNWDIKGTLDKGQVEPFPLDSKLKGGFGFLFARLQSADVTEGVESHPLRFYRGHKLNAFVQVTNLGLTVKCSPETNFVFVSELKTAKPVAEAAVELRDDSGKILWQGKTNKDGFVTTPGWAVLKLENPENRYYGYSNPRIWFIASRGNDDVMVASNWGTGIQPWSFDINYESRQTYPKYAMHVYTDRGLYQAGETVHIKGLYRQHKSNKWILSDNKEVSLQIKNSRGEEVLNTNLPISSFGSFTTDFEISPEAVTGFYSITITDPNKPAEQSDRTNYLSGSGHFQVEAFRPAKFESTARLSQESYIYGEKAEGTLRGWYLFGAPMKKAPVEWRARLWTTTYEPEGAPGYSFSPQRHWSAYGEYNSSVLLASNQGQLNDKGELKVQFPIEAKALAGPMSLQLEGTVTDEDRQALSGRATAVVHPGDFYVGLKLSSSFIEKSKPLTVSVITVTPDGKRIPDQKVQIKIVRREWHSIRKAGVRGRVEWVTETKDEVKKTFDLKSTNETVDFTYEPDRSGFYLVQAEAKDRKGRAVRADRHFYATGRDYVAWARNDDDRIELISDQTKYKPGETAKIMVKSPFEKALAVVTLEREGIIHQFTTNIVGSADVISLPLENRFVPNVYVSVILLQGRTKNNEFTDKGEDVGKPAFKIGYLNIPVDPGIRRLKVTAKPSSKTYKPGQSATVEILVVDHKGKPVTAEFSISVADRGILDLIAYKTPDSFNSFYGQRALSVETVESRQHVVGQRNYGEKGENRGGGGADGLLADMELRRKFRGSAYWKAAVVTDANGKASVQFPLPDNLTTFKVMVTAQTKDALFGAGDAEFTIKKPLMLQPSLPRFARLGDKFSAGVVVHNLTGKKGEVQIEGQGRGFKLVGESLKKVVLDNGQSQEVRFDFEAVKVGNATFAFGGKLGDEKDGFEQKTPIILPRVTEAVALYEDTESRARQTLKIPTDMYPEAGVLKVEAASTALIGLKEGVQYLQEYPHECLEQKVSRVLPFVLAEDLLGAFGISDLKGEKRRAVMKEVLNQIPRFQRGDGGFGYWPGSIYSSEYLTAFTMFFLHEAKKDGFEPNEQMVMRALQYMQSVLRRNDSQQWNYPYRRNGMLSTQAFLVYSLALWGKKEPAYITRLHNDLFQMPYFGRAMLLKAITLNGMDSSLSDSVATSLFNSIKIDPTRAHFEEQDPNGLEWLHYSAVQTTAFVLQAMLESGREFPQASKVIRWMMDERKIGRWRSTHENIFVFYALSEYFRRYEKDEPNFTATIKIGGTEALTHLFQGRSVELQQKNIPLTTYKEGEELGVDIQKEGVGRLYYGLRMIYAPKGIMKAREEGLSIRREITLENGDPLPDVIKAGSKLMVKLTVTTPFDRSFIAIDDWLPAGFQIINTRLATASSQDTENLNKAEDSVEKRWWGTFNHTEYYDERVGIYADYLAHGTHTAFYMVTAITPGTFSLPPAKVEGMYTPEVFGHTVSGTIQIK